MKKKIIVTTTSSYFFYLHQMNKNITNLYQISQKNSRIIIGLMSGTSLDGLDIALCQIEGAGLQTKIEIKYFVTVLYNDVFKAEVKQIFSKAMVNLETLCLLNEWIGSQHAAMINECLKNWHIKNNEVDIIASHGQTIYHAPYAQHKKKGFGNATLQIGDGDHIAVGTGIITLADFRQKQIAAGGEGAPLAIYGDYILFSKLHQHRVMLNIGGIANFTFLHGSLNATKMFSTDVGPGNTMMDAVIQQHYPTKYYDENATVATKGSINNDLLAALKDNPFFEKDFPKTTGPEVFNMAYLQAAQIKSGTENLGVNDVMATLCKFSAVVIVDALQRGVTEKNYTIYCSGGGMHNPLLMAHIKNSLPNIVIKTTADLHINPDAKEAVLFAILANEALCGGKVDYGNISVNISMGKVCFPS